MIAPHELIAGVSQAAVTSLAAALWQGALLAGAAALGLRLLPETPAPVRFTIWFTVFVLVAGLPFLSGAAPHGATPHTVAISHPLLTIDAEWCLWIAAIWGSASLVRAITLVVAAFRVRALWKRARPVSGQFPAMARKAQVCVSDETDRPTVIGFFAPRIILPEWLIKQLSSAELEQVVLHEAGHLSRRDDWLNLLQKIALVLFPLNPALAWVERRLCFERELACDESVLRATGAPKAYAECLATIAEYRLARRGLVRELALALGALGRESELAQRVLRILRGGGRMKPGNARLVFGGSMLTLLFAAGALERSPQMIGFRHAAELQPAVARSKSVGLGAAQIVAVRASVAPGEQWTPVGDASPHLAKRIAAGRSSRAESEVHADESKFVKGRAASQAAAALLAQATVDPPAGVMVNPATVAIKASLASQSRAARVTYPAQMIRTVATRQVATDGEVVVTRSMTFTTWDTAARIPNGSPTSTAAADEDQAIQQQSTRSYAAVPVQGGWLVFQL